MCIFGNIVEDKLVTGYKVAVKDNNWHYYSIVTGIRYKKGKVPIPKTYGKYNLRINFDFADVLWKCSHAHNTKYAGMTAIFKNRMDAESVFSSELKNNKNIVLLEMTLTGKIYNGSYQEAPVYLGNTITSIKKIN